MIEINLTVNIPQLETLMPTIQELAAAAKDLAAAAKDLAAAIAADEAADDKALKAARDRIAQLEADLAAATDPATLQQIADAIAGAKAALHADDAGTDETPPPSR